MIAPWPISIQFKLQEDNSNQKEEMHVGILGLIFKGLTFYLLLKNITHSLC